MSVELHHADCLDVLRAMPDGHVNAVICDPPYSERTHSGHDATEGLKGHRALSFAHWTQADVDAVIPELCRVSSGWVVVMTDTDLAVPIRDAMYAAGRYAFAPLPFLDVGSRVRLSGDGPSCWTIWIVVCRPATKWFSTWGTLPGGYIAGPGWRDRRYVGGKPVQLMRELVRDYSRPGDLVLDPFLGAGTTGVACKELGRDFIGVERDEAAFAIASERIKATPHKPGLCFARTKRRKQTRLL